LHREGDLVGSSKCPGPANGQCTDASVKDGTLVPVVSTPPSPAGPTPQSRKRVVAPAAAGTSAHDLDAAIEALHLRGRARIAAYALKKAHPGVVFTSGRRSLVDQARAMAQNVAGNRQWIAQTYAASELSARCQRWLDINAKKTSQSDVEQGLLAVLQDATDTERSYLSKHLSGDAFDVQPVTDGAAAIKRALRQLVQPHGRFLDVEGGLVRWHAQF
jgi:hypothetical protein